MRWHTRCRPARCALLNLALPPSPNPPACPPCRLAACMLPLPPGRLASPAHQPLWPGYPPAAPLPGGRTRAAGQLPVGAAHASGRAGAAVPAPASALPFQPGGEEGVPPRGWRHGLTLPPPVRRLWGRTGSWRRATRCAAPPASASSGARRRCSPACLHGWAAVRPPPPLPLSPLLWHHSASRAAPPQQHAPFASAIPETPTVNVEKCITGSIAGDQVAAFCGCV